MPAIHDSIVRWLFFSLLSVILALVLARSSCLRLCHCSLSFVVSTISRLSKSTVNSGRARTTVSLFRLHTYWLPPNTRILCLYLWHWPSLFVAAAAAVVAAVVLAVTFVVSRCMCSLWLADEKKKQYLCSSIVSYMFMYTCTRMMCEMLFMSLKKSSTNHFTLNLLTSQSCTLSQQQ